MSFEPSRYLNQTILAVPKSGIRKFFDVAATMPGAISLGVGEPDFVTPYHTATRPSTAFWMAKPPIPATGDC